MTDQSIHMPPNSQQADPLYPIYLAVQALSGNDPDGATLRNNVGFSRYDSQFGQSLASRPWERWSPAQKFAAWNMLRKYRSQLALSHGIDYGAIPEPPDPKQRPNVANPQGVSAGRNDRPPIRSITLAGDHIEVRFQNMSRAEFQEILNEVKNIPGRTFKDGEVTKSLPDQDGYVTETTIKDPHWEIPYTAYAAVAVDAFARRFKFTATPEVIAKVKELAAKTDKMEEASRAEDAEITVPDFGGNGLELMPFQRAGVAYGVEVQRCWIADDMGLGKTLQALGILQAKEAYPALVIVPAVVKINWKREADKWLHHRYTMIVSGKVTAEEIAEAMPDVVIINYDILDKNKDELLKVAWKAVVFDEAHRLKNGKAQRSVAALELAEDCDIRLLLTGTPLLNRPNELVHPLKILGRIKDVSPRGIKAFLNRYCGGWDGYGYNGATNTEELHKILRQTCMLRRKKEDVLKELPEVFRSVISLELDNWPEYDRAEADIIAWVGEQATRDDAFLAELGDLTDEQQNEAIAAHRRGAEEAARRAEQLVRIEKLKQVAARGKLAKIVRWTKEFLEGSDGKLIMFATHLDIEQTLIRAFPGCAYILGGQSIEERQANVDRFMNDAACRLVVCALAAAGEGITLTASSTVAFVELGWTPAAHDQAEARSHRIGQKNNVTAIYFVANETIEEQIAELLDEKRKVVKAIADGQALEQGESIMVGLWEYLKTRAAQMENGELPAHHSSDSDPDEESDPAETEIED